MTGLRADLAVILFNDSKLLKVPFKALGGWLLPTSPIHLLQPCPFFQIQQEGCICHHCPNPEVVPWILHASPAAHPLRLGSRAISSMIAYLAIMLISHLPRTRQMVSNATCQRSFMCCLGISCLALGLPVSSCFESKNCVLVNECSLSTWPSIWPTEGQQSMRWTCCWMCVRSLFFWGNFQNMTCGFSFYESTRIT